MENFRKPTLREIFDALVDEDSDPDWDFETLEMADPGDVERIKKLVSKPGTFSELRLEVQFLEEE